MCGYLHNKELEAQNISWSAFFANRQQQLPKPPAITSLLPLFREAAHTPAMVKHGMDIIRNIIQTVNPGQTPVLTVDQPLYAIAKKIQWKWPEKYGEKFFCAMMGGLHIEMAVLKMIGKWLNKSGWTYLLAAANITTEVRAENILQASNVTKCQWAHQITAAVLFKLMLVSYNEYKESTSDEHLDFKQWYTKKAAIHPQFCYWYRTLQLQILFLRFLRAQREHNYEEYVLPLLEITPWMLALDHFNYARWMSVHLADLLSLEVNCRDVYTEFLKGNFVNQKTNKTFSGMALDQVHEQLNAMVKGDGGVIGITQNDETLRRWSVAGPETARLLFEYNNKQNEKIDVGNKHHEQIPSVQKKFINNVESLCYEFENAGNPFSETSNDLYALDTKNIMSDIVKNSVESAENIGKTQFNKLYQKESLKIEHHYSTTFLKTTFPCLI